MERSTQSTRATTHSRRAVLGGAGRVAAGVAIGALVGSGAVAPARARAASATTILFRSFGFTCEAPAFVAQAQGFFKDEGLDVTLSGDANAAEALTRLVKGSADASSEPAFTLAPPFLPQGIAVGDVVATTGLQRGCSSLLVAADSPYRTVADLKGQKVAAGASWRFIYGEPMAQAGLDPLKDIDWQPQLPFPMVAAALANRSVAAALSVEPLSATLEAAGVARALMVQDMPPMRMDYCCSVAVSGALLRADRPKAAAITRALMRGSAWAAAHPAETAQLEITGKYVTASLADNQTAIATIAFAPSVSAALTNTRDVFGRMIKLGFLDPGTDVSALLDRIFVPVTADLPAQGAAQMPKSGGAPLALPLGGGLALLGLGLLARRAGRPPRDAPNEADATV
jgi:NitT/TauT family transport system substrate-binding protein